MRRAHPRMCCRLVPARGLADWHLRFEPRRLEREDVAWRREPASDGRDGADSLMQFALERAQAPLDPTTDPHVDLSVRELEPARTLLVLRFWHPILDERGGELLLRELSAAYAGEAVRGDSGEGAALEPIPSTERIAAFRRARSRLADLTPAPPHRLPAGPPDAPAEITFERTVLDAAATDAWLARAQASPAPLGEGLAQLALVARALASDAPDGAFIALPLTVQLRSPRARAPVAANAVSFLWYSFRAAETRAPDEFAATLLATSRKKVVADEERDASILLERARRMPLSLYRRELVRRDGSPRFSASISTLGEVMNGACELFGLPLRDFAGLPIFPTPPGLGFVFWRAAGRLSFATGAWTRAVSRPAAAAIHRRIAGAFAFTP